MATFTANALTITDTVTGVSESSGAWSFDSAADLEAFMDNLTGDNSVDAATIDDINEFGYTTDDWYDLEPEQRDMIIERADDDAAFEQAELRRMSHYEDIADEYDY